MRYSKERLQRVDDMIFEIMKSVEHIQAHEQDNCISEITQLCSDLQTMTEELRSILESEK